MAKRIFKDVTPTTALAFAIRVYKEQGFIRSGEGYHKYNEDGESVGFVYDNKSQVIKLLEESQQPTSEELSDAEEIMNKFNGKFMLKKLTNGLTNFERSVSEAFSSDLTSFTVAVIASIPHMNVIDVKRKAVEDRIEELRFKSEYFGEIRQRYDIEVEVIDVKFIQSSGVYMITTVFNDSDIIKFWWRDQPDLTDIIDGRRIKIRGTVNRHEEGKFTNAKETMLNRVKVTSN